MSTTIIRKLRDELARIESERARLEAEAEHFRHVIAYYEQHADDAEGDSAQAPTKALANEMWQILEAEGTPLHYREIHDRLRQRGVTVPGKEPSRNVGAHLSADPRFENIRRGVWGLRSWKGRSHEQETAYDGLRPIVETAAGSYSASAAVEGAADRDILDDESGGEVHHLFASRRTTAR